MSRWGILLLALVLVGAQGARAETWTAGLVLVKESSSQTCEEVPQVVWTLSLEAGALSGTNNTGAKFSAPVGPDGAVKASYSVLGSFELIEMVLTGNARTRQLETFTAKYSCRYKFTSR
ncbi:MAG: hypothetical protein KIT18_14560 [Burkholderiales bacterium]|nr:hypothetical protein [Burkholderiales bacterium]